jgi:hypothetical protein
MLDPQVFQAAWVLLCDRFGREQSTPLMLAYYKTLAPQLSDVEFKAACQRIFTEREFFPRPADFLDGVRPDPQVEALAQWEQVHELMKGEPANLTPEAKRVVAMLGGQQKLRNTPLDAVQYVRRDFMELYGDTVELGRRENFARIEPTPESLRLTAAIMDAARKPDEAA